MRFPQQNERELALKGNSSSRHADHKEEKKATKKTKKKKNTDYRTILF